MVIYKEHIIKIPQSQLEKNGIPYYLNNHIGNDGWIIISTRLINPDGLGGPFTLVALSWKYEDNFLQIIKNIWEQLDTLEKESFIKHITNEV